MVYRRDGRCTEDHTPWLCAGTVTSVGVQCTVGGWCVAQIMQNPEALTPNPGALTPSPKLFILNLQLRTSHFKR